MLKLVPGMFYKIYKTLQEEGIYVWYIFCIKQSQWVWFSNDFVNIYSYFDKFNVNYIY
jgi:hypothetical protein